MSLALLEPLRHTLIAAQLRPDPALRRLALARYDQAWRSIDRLPEREDLHERLYRMLPSDWPLWVERYRHRPTTDLIRAVSAA